MKKKLLGLFVVLSLITIFGCTNTVQNPIEDPKENNTSTSNNAQDISSKLVKNEYTILVGNESFSLSDFDRLISFEALFGKSTFEETKVLGPSSDTYMGSYEKTLKFKGIELVLFSPKGDGQTFFLISIRFNSKNIKTFRGIGIGDTLSKLKEIYPEAIVISGNEKDPNNCTYMYQEPSSGFKSMRFEVKAGEIQEIHLLDELG